MQLLLSFAGFLRKFFAPFPHFSKKTLQPVLPFVSWYTFLRGILEVINGLRDISWGIRYHSLPQMFVTLLDVAPVFFLISGVLSVSVGILYLKTFPSLTNARSYAKGWQQWAAAAAGLTLTKLYEVVFLRQSAMWLVLSALIGWYIIFEFERVMKGGSAAKRKRST